MPRAQFSLRSVSLGGLVLLVVVGCGQAQIDRATLTGTVTDPTRAVVRDAKIHAKDQATGLESEAESNSQGVYRVPGLAVGTYTVTVTHTGFATAQFQDVVLLVGETRTLDAHLKVGAVMQRIVVEGSRAGRQQLHHGRCRRHRHSGTSAEVNDAVADFRRSRC
ncbi:MAG: hypothetical protein DMF41_13435 [Verrucomicrobia bacterium]|nr:MAG: hypothetical protein DMF41_13435 [Verrucomicrobiota bacterium]